MYSIRLFDLEMKVKDFDDLDENWQVKVRYQRMQKNGASRSTVRSQYIIEHFRTDRCTNVRTNERTYDLTANTILTIGT